MLRLQGISLSTLRYRMTGYISQLQMYLNMTGIEEGLLIMDNKDDQRWKDYRIVRDEEWIKPILARCERLEPYRANRIVPACSCIEPDKRKVACLHLPEEEVPLTIFRRGVTR